MAHAIIEVFDRIEAIELEHVPHEPIRLVDGSGRTFGYRQWRRPSKPLAERYDEIRRASLRLSVGQFAADVAAYIAAERDARLSLRSKYAAD